MLLTDWLPAGCPDNRVYCYTELTVFFSGHSHKTIAGTGRAHPHRDGQADQLNTSMVYLQMVTNTQVYKLLHRTYFYHQ